MGSSEPLGRGGTELCQKAGYAAGGAPSSLGAQEGVGPREAGQDQAFGSQEPAGGRGGGKQQCPLFGVGLRLSGGAGPLSAVMWREDQPL